MMKESKRERIVQVLNTIEKVAHTVEEASEIISIVATVGLGDITQCHVGVRVGVKALILAPKVAKGVSWLAAFIRRRMDYTPSTRSIGTQTDQ